MYPGFGNISVGELGWPVDLQRPEPDAQQSFSRGLEAFATYTWSHAIDDAPEQNNIDSSNLVLSDPSNRRRDRGNSLTDRRHAFNGNLSMCRQSPREVARPCVVNGNVFAFMATIQSGDVFNIGSNQILNGDPSIPASLQRPVVLWGPNTLETPAVPLN